MAMGFGRKQTEETVMEQVDVWECSSEDCKCWLRDNFKSSEEPKCPKCSGSMRKTTRELPVVKNNSIFTV